MEFSCSVVPNGDSTLLRSSAVLAEHLGYGRFWVPDQHFLGDPFVILGDLARHVSINLGLALTSPFSRHPVQIARAMATVCQLDDQPRDWILGIGRGNSNLVLGPLGVDAGASVTRMIDGVAAIKRLLAGDTVEPTASRLVAEPVRLGLDPVGCSVYVGTRGPTTIRRAVAVADGVIIESMFRPDLAQWCRSILDESATNGFPHVSWQAVFVTEPGHRIPDDVRAFAAMLLRTTSPSVLKRMNVGEALIEKAAVGMVRAEDLTDAEVRTFVAVGSPAELRDAVLGAEAAGITAWSSIFIDSRGQSAAEGMTRFAESVIEPLRRRVASGRTEHEAHRTG